MKKIYTIKHFLALCFACITFASQSQNIILFQQTQQQNVLVNYNYVQMTRNDMTRQLVQGLANDIPKNIYNTEYTVNFNYDLRLLQVSSTLYNITMNRKPITVNGDVSIGHFRLDDVLMPDQYSFDMIIMMPGNYVMKKQRLIILNGLFNIQLIIKQQLTGYWALSVNTSMKLVSVLLRSSFNLIYWLI